MAITALHTDGTYLYVGYEDGSLVMLDLATKKTLKRMKSHMSAIIFLFSDDRFLYSLSLDSYLNIWDKTSENFTLKSSIICDDKPILAAFMDDEFIYTASADNTLKVWDKLLHDLVLQYDTFDSGILSITGDSKRIYTTQNDNTIKIWKTPHCRLKEVLWFKNKTVEVFEFSEVESQVLYKLWREEVVELRNNFLILYLQTLQEKLKENKIELSEEEKQALFRLICAPENLKKGLIFGAEQNDKHWYYSWITHEGLKKISDSDAKIAEKYRTFLQRRCYALKEALQLKEKTFEEIIGQYEQKKLKDLL